MTDPVPALTIRQPWAELIILGRKTMEIRSWEIDHRGPLWIHAGLLQQPELDAAFGVENVVRGAFVGQVDLVSISPIDPGRWEAWRKFHLDGGRYQPGLFGWFFSGPRRLTTPVPARGQRGLFTPDPLLATELGALLPSASGQ